MATLNNADFTEIKKLIKRDATARDIVNAWGLDKQTWKDLFQEAEDWNTNAFLTTPTTSFKAALDVITTTTNQRAKMIWTIWSRWKGPQVI